MRRTLADGRSRRSRTSWCAQWRSERRPRRIWRSAPGLATPAAQQFELRRPARRRPATYTLRSDSPWLTAPATVTLTGRQDVSPAPATIRPALKPPGAYVGTVTGWGAGLAGGPGVPAGGHASWCRAAVTAGPRELRSGVPVRVRWRRCAPSSGPTAPGRSQVRVSVDARREGARLPARARRHAVPGRGRPAAGRRQQSAVYQVDARDVVARHVRGRWLASIPRIGASTPACG